MTKYVIQSTHEFLNKKTGRRGTDIGYFKCIVLGMVKMMEGNPDNAYHYEFFTEAQRDRRKWFAGKKSIKVIPLDQAQREYHARTNKLLMGW